MTILSIDIETYSSVDLIKSGVYKYVEAPDFEILLLAFAYDDEPVKVIDLAREFSMDEIMWNDQLMYELNEGLNDPNVIKTAFNANFERTCLAKHFNKAMPPEQWRCTAVHALNLGLPRDLAGVAKVIGLDAQKDMAGKNLIKYFSLPCKPTKVNEGRTRNHPEHDQEKWQQFIDYCEQDVVVEREIRKRLEKFPLPKFEHDLWALDQRINDRGVLIDSDIMENAILFDTKYKKELILPEMQDLTQLANPNSVAQLKGWLEEQGLEVESLAKGQIPALLEQTENEDVHRVLALRLEMGKTSVKKYTAMQKGQCADGRIRGILQFYGANRTGRWAGRLVQVHNLPRGSIKSDKDLDTARSLVKAGDYDLFQLLFENVPDVLSSLIRTTFIPSPGRRLLVSDFSAIEARVIAWLAGEQWRLDVFNTHGKIYEASASAMFGIPLEEITKALRQKGKVSELALGYQGSVGAMIAMGALDMGLDEDELKPLVDAWREANPAIVKCWNAMEHAAIKTMAEKKTVTVQHGIQFSVKSGILFIKLPSGRKLAYAKPRLENDMKFNKVGLTYEGIHEGKWTRLRTYGGKLVENIVQAIARDALAEALMRMKDVDLVMHVHDEIVADAPDNLSLEEMDELMGQSINWAPGLPLTADGFETDFYRKD